MTSIAASDGAQPGPAAGNLGRRRTSGIYGAIITAAILGTVGGHASTTVLVISVVVTLLVYWIAEEYAEVLGEHTAGGRPRARPLPKRRRPQSTLQWWQELKANIEAIDRGLARQQQADIDVGQPWRPVRHPAAQPEAGRSSAGGPSGTRDRRRRRSRCPASHP